MKPGTALSRKIIRELKARGWFATQISAAMNTGIPDILAEHFDPDHILHIEVKALEDDVRDSQINWAHLLCFHFRGRVHLIREIRDGYSLEFYHAELGRFIVMNQYPTITRTIDSLLEIFE